MESQTTQPKERNNNESTDSVQKDPNPAHFSSHQRLPTPGRPTIARADAGDRLESDCVERDRRDCGQPPPASALSFAMAQGAVYDAVNAIDRGSPAVPPEASVQIQRVQRSSQQQPPSWLVGFC